MDPSKNDPEQLQELANLLVALHEPMDKIWPRFWSWKLVHPDVEDRLVGLARLAMARGRKRYGISPIWEVLRWHIAIVDGKTEEFKCSNDYRSRYARYLMWKHPDLTDFFELRPLRATVEQMDLPPRPPRPLTERLAAAKSNHSTT